MTPNNGPQQAGSLDQPGCAPSAPAMAPSVLPVASSPPASSNTTASLKEILRIRQQARSRKSCLPCRERKVRCNKEQPCSTCVKRAHADLCVYGDKPAAPSLAADLAPARRGNENLQSLSAEYSAAARLVYGDVDQLSFARQPLDTVSVTASPAARMLGPASQLASTTHTHTLASASTSHTLPPESTNHSVPSPHSVSSTSSTMRPNLSLSDAGPSAAPTINHFSEAPAMGALSWPTLAPSAQGAAHKSAFQTGLLPLLGAGPSEVAESTASYAVTGQMTGAPTNINTTLPCNKTLSSLFAMHRSYVHPFVNITYNLDAMEHFMCTFMTKRLEIGNNPAPASDEDVQRVPLLHAILASGAQFSNLPLKLRYNLTQTHTKLAFESLRTVDYLARPSKYALQTLLLLGYVLQNDMKPQASWVLGGTTVRLAKCLIPSRTPQRKANSPILTTEASTLRMATVWQDTLLSLAFDRPPNAVDMDLEADLPPLTPALDHGGLEYCQAMNWLCHITLSYFLNKDKPGHDSDAMSLVCDLEKLDTYLSPHITDIGACHTVQNLQAHYAYQVHRNFSIASICRPVLSKRADEIAPDDAVILAQLQETLTKCAASYIHLRSIARHACRSWSFIHNGLASVLLLSLMAETRNTPTTRKLQDDLVQSFLSYDSEFLADADLLPGEQFCTTHKKALKAIQTLRSLSENEAAALNNVQSGDSGGLEASLGTAPSTTTATSTMAGTDATILAQFGGCENFSFPMDDNFSALEVFDLIMADSNGQTFAGI